MSSKHSWFWQQYRRETNLCSAVFLGPLEQLYLHRWSLNAQQAACRPKERASSDQDMTYFRVSKKKRDRGLHIQHSELFPESCSELFPENTVYMEFSLYGRISSNSQPHSIKTLCQFYCCIQYLSPLPKKHSLVWV